MKINSKTITLGAIGLVVLSVLGVGGYFLAIQIEEVHEQNVSDLAGFGSVVTPGTASDDGSTQGVDGQKQLAPTFGEEKMSASDKIIISLSKEKELLVKELADRQREINKLSGEIEQLRRYKETNERFAPRLLSEEKARAVEKLQVYLDESKDADRFNGFQKEAMALDSANTYLSTLRKYQLVFDDAQKDQLIDTHLPSYAFCVGESIGLIANSRSEEKQVISYLKGENERPLPSRLMEDLTSVRTPCLLALNERINILLKG